MEYAIIKTTKEVPERGKGREKNETQDSKIYNILYSSCNAFSTIGIKGLCRARCR